MATRETDSSRKAVVERLRREQQRAERRRSLLIVGVCALVGLIIIGLGAYPLLREKSTQDRLAGASLAEIGKASADAGCQKVVTAPAGGNADHQPEGQKLFYRDAPPAFGPHFPVAAPMERKFYTDSDRPDLGYLVHNLEHGYTILWYDETAAADDDALAEVKAIAKKFPSTTEQTHKFIAAPWTEDDGAPFPEGTNVALTHWSVGEGGDKPQQVGVWQYCTSPSGEAVEEFMADYPFSDSPEPNAA